MAPLLGLIAKRGFLAFKCINASDVDGEEEEVAAVSDGDVDDGSENHQCDHGLSSLCPGSTCGRSSFAVLPRRPRVRALMVMLVMMMVTVMTRIMVMMMKKMMLIMIMMMTEEFVAASGDRAETTNYDEEDVVDQEEQR